MHKSINQGDFLAAKSPGFLFILKDYQTTVTIALFERGGIRVLSVLSFSIQISLIAISHNFINQRSKGTWRVWQASENGIIHFDPLTCFVKCHDVIELITPLATETESQIL